MYRQNAISATTSSAATVITKMVARMPEAIAMWGISKEFGDAGMALQDAFTVVVSTEMVVKVVGTKFLASLFVF